MKHKEKECHDLGIIMVEAPPRTMTAPNRSFSSPSSSRSIGNTSRVGDHPAAVSNPEVSEAASRPAHPQQEDTSEEGDDIK